MLGKWLNLFLRFCGYISALKQKIVEAKNWAMALPSVFLLLLTELLFWLFSLPLFFVVSPKKLQESGFIFPIKEKELHVFIVRRKIGLATVLSAAGIFLLKFVFIGLITTYFLGTSVLLATVQNWTFSTSTDYIFDSAKIEITGAAAQLKDLGGGIFSADQPTIYPINSLAVPSLTGWSAFTETAAKNGGEIYYQLSDDNGATWKFWNHSAWANAATSSVTVGPSLVKITGGGCCGMWPANLIKSGNSLFFIDYDSVNGSELWKSDGTASGTAIVKDINPGGDGYDGQESNLTDVNGTLFFSATDGVHGSELWKSDGTESGTAMIKDINPGSGDSSVWDMINVNGIAYFSATDGANGQELWKSDGTESGTVMVRDINSGSSGSSPQNLTYCEGSVFFTAQPGSMMGSTIYKTDGTASGTVALTMPAMSTPNSLFCAGNILYFTANNIGGNTGVELGKTDGTDSGTVMVKDINPGGNSSYPQNFADINGTLYFSATDGVHGVELWKSDGTSDGTVMLKDINLGNGDSNPVQFFDNGDGTIYFDASDGPHGEELWKTDGTENGTVMVKDINENNGDSWPNGFTNIYGKIYFSATDRSGGKMGNSKYQLWRTDGTESGTLPVADLNPGGDDGVGGLIKINNTLYFTADDGVNGTQLWIYGPSAPNTDFNTSADINANISKFSTSTGQIKWRAFLAGNGTQQVILNNVVVGYTQNLTAISNVSAVQDLGADIVTIHYDLDKIATTSLEISSDGGATWNVATSTLSGDIGASLAVGDNKIITWNAGIDFNNQENATMRVRLRGDIKGTASSYYESADFFVDTKAPSGLTALNKFSSTADSVTLAWQSSADAHFSHYELWHGSNENDVNNRTGAASIWSTSTDANLGNPLIASTTITGLNLTNDYFVKIWAVDDYNNQITVPAINVYEAPVTPVAVAKITTGGGAAVIVDKVPPEKPILNPLITPTRETAINISGLAEANSRIDLYDQGVLVQRLNNTADNNGRFSQMINFSEGEHILTVKAVDFSNNTSISSDPVKLNITTITPVSVSTPAISAPIVLSPQNNAQVTEETPTLIGVADPLASIEIILDKKNNFIAKADANGAWQFKLPADFALKNGPHTFALTAKDLAGNKSAEILLTLNKAALPVAPVGTATIIPAALPPANLVRENIEAVALPGVPIPQVIQVNTVASNNTIIFSGTALPNQDVLVYIHSDQALIYSAKADANGIWQINHSQTELELAPGQHTIYAVAVDAAANVKSQPSPVSTFTISKNFWVSLFDSLNLKTTIVTLAVLLLLMFWLFQIKRKEAVIA